MISWLRLVEVGAIVALIMIGANLSYHRGFASGATDRIAYYEPLLRAASEAKRRADERADEAEHRARAISMQSEKDHAEFVVELDRRVVATGQHLADIMRQRAAAERAARRCQVSTVAGAAGEPAASAAGDERDRRFADRVSGVGGRCEHDAAQVAEFQRWYAEQRANAAALSP